MFVLLKSTGWKMIMKDKTNIEINTRWFYRNLKNKKKLL